ncbi:MAG: hypothetical protein ACRDD2_00450 [Sarcina sp.]
MILIIMYIIQALIIIGLSALGANLLNKGVSGISVAIIIGAAVITFIMQSLSTGAIIKLVDERRKGNKFTVFGGFKYMVRKLPQLIGATIIMMLVALITGFLATIIYTFLDYYIGQSGVVFGMFYGTIFAIVDILLLSFIIPFIVREDINFIKAFIKGVKLAFTRGGDVIIKIIALMIFAAIVIAIGSLFYLIPYAGVFITLIISEIVLVVFEIGQLNILEEYSKK